ncbi:hypothetical protein I302_108275 [Kwoniella bestiolae CBS 10118]|uniref:Uncharacterized protein n=1 Tax=Kwoniella bestiolae CBS 10118 TaxID=1296100 RepID=A0A1B9FW63_9TREE|nr:hypothetical protein I302_07358 [Kwoniella bestiolae CBS 10118]OCF23008.1 hypothetical protein I302_07358 [Kwoniella bestiolae CBS 10118]
MPCSSSNGQASCQNHAHANRKLEILDDGIMPLPLRLPRPSTAWSSTAPTRVNTLNDTRSKGKAPCPPGGFEDIELQELGDVVTPLPTCRGTGVSRRPDADQSGSMRCTLYSSSREDDLDRIAPAIPLNSNEPIQTVTENWEWKQGRLYTQKDPQEKLDEPATRRGEYLDIIPAWRAIAKRSKRIADDMSMSKYKSGSDTARFFDLDTQERKAREKYSQATQAWDGCMSHLYGRSIDAACRTTARMLGSLKKEQRKRYGRCTEVNGDLLGDTLMEAMSRHFDGALTDLLKDWKYDIPIKNKQMKKAETQNERLREISKALQRGTISMSGNSDSITCSWSSRTDERGGIPGLSTLWRKEPKDRSRVIQETRWTWRGGEVVFDEE